MYLKEIRVASLFREVYGVINRFFGSVALPVLVYGEFKYAEYKPANLPVSEGFI